MPIDPFPFEVLADRTLHALEAALCEVDGIDVDLQSGVLTIEFGDGESFVVNSHSAARQIWMAAGASAWHFDGASDTPRWTAARTGEELWSCLGREVGAKLGRAIVLEPPG
jgi:iron-sulfur cluster assembly protein CyaY